MYCEISSVNKNAAGNKEKVYTQQELLEFFMAKFIGE